MNTTSSQLLVVLYSLVVGMKIGPEKTPLLSHFWRILEKALLLEHQHNHNYNIMNESDLCEQWSLIHASPSRSVTFFRENIASFAEFTKQTVECQRRQSAHYLDALMCTVLQAIKSIFTSDEWQAEEQLFLVTVSFMLGLLVAPEFNVPEKQLVTNLLKKYVPSYVLLSACPFVEIVPQIMTDEPAATAEDVVVAQMTMLECILGDMVDPNHVIVLLYTDLAVLVETQFDATDDECDALMREQRRQQGPELGITLSSFITHTLKGSPRCRLHAYRLLGMVSSRLFARLGKGPKIVQLLLKKRTIETVENRWVITAILWNLIYIWGDQLHFLILSSFERSVQGAPDSHWDLLCDIWGGPPLRSLAVLSACRLVASRRDQSVTAGTGVIRDLLVSLLIRPSLQRTVRNQISNEYIRQQAPARKKPHQEAPATFTLSLCALEDEDQQDALLIQRAIAKVRESGTEVRTVEMEGLVVALQRSLSMAVGVGAGAGFGSGPEVVNSTALQRGLEIWCSLVHQLCGASNNSAPDAYEQWWCDHQVNMDDELRNAVSSVQGDLLPMLLAASAAASAAIEGR